MEVFQKDDSFVQRFGTEMASSHLLLPCSLPVKTAVKFFDLSNLGLIDVFLAQLGSHNFGIVDTVLKVEILPDIEEGVDIFPLFFVVELLILVFLLSGYQFGGCVGAEDGVDVLLEFPWFLLSFIDIFGQSLRFLYFGIVFDENFRMVFTDKSIPILNNLLFLFSHFFRFVAVLVNDDEFAVDNLEEVETDAINAA